MSKKFAVINQDYLTPEQSAQLDHLNAVEVEFLERAKNVAADLINLRESFRDMVVFAHENKISPERVTLILTAAGFVKPRISEFKAIAYADPETYHSYVDGNMGFRPALEKARDEKAEKTGRKNRRHSKNKKMIAALFKAFAKYAGANPEFKAFSFQEGLAVLTICKAPFDGVSLTPGGTSVYTKTSGKQEPKKDKTV